MKTPIRIAMSVAVVAMPVPAFAAPLSEAEITHIIKDVRTVDPKKTPRPARLRERLHSQQSVRTGIASRTELLFNDKTLTRIGANSHFSFTEGTRNLELYRGVILLQVPKGAGGAQIRTAAITAAVTGTTILLEAGPGFTKVIVLEGHANITAHGDKAHRKTVIKPGQAVIMPNTAKQVPPPVFINLAVLVETSALVSGTWTADLNEAPIVAAAAQQSPKDFTATNLAIIGPGTEVVFLPEGVRIAAAIPGKLGPPPFIPGTTVITPATTILTDPSITSGGVTHYGTMYRSPAEDGPATQFVFGSGAAPQPAFDAAFASLNQPAVFRFADLQLQGGPRIITTGGPTDLVLASMGAITSGGAGAQTVNLTPLTSLTLAALGPISLSSELSIVGPGSRLWLSNHGPGNDIDVNSALDLAALRIDSAGNLTMSGPANIATGTLNSAGGLQVTGAVTATGPLTLRSAGDVMLSAPITAPTFDLTLSGGGVLSGNGTINAGVVTVASDTPLTLSTAGGPTLNGIVLGSLDSLELRATTINTPTDLLLGPGIDLTFSSGIAGSNLSAGNLSFGGAATFSGDVTAAGTFQGTSLSGNYLNFGGAANFTGMVTARNAVIASSTLTAAGVSAPSVSFPNAQLSASSLSQSGATLTFNSLPISVSPLRELKLGGAPLTLASDLTLSSVALDLAGTVTAQANTTISAQTLALENLTAPGNLTLAASGDLTVGGILSSNGLLTATAGGTLQGSGSALIDAKEVMLRSGGTLTFSHTGNSATFGTVPLDLTGTTGLNLGADTLQLVGDIFLNKSLTLAGHLMTPANSTINVNDLNIGRLTVAGPLILQGGGTGITVTGPISGNNTTVQFFGPSLNLTGATDAPTLNMRYLGTHFSMDQSITVREFRGDAGADFSSAPGAMLDATDVILRYFNAGPDVVLSQAAADTAAVSSNGRSLALDLERTTGLTLNGADGRDVIVQGNFTASRVSVSLGDNGTDTTRINGNMIVGALGVGGNNAIIDGTITSGDLRLSVAKSIASSVVQNVRVLILNLAESPATLSQAGNIATFTSHPSGLPTTSLQFNTSNLVELDLKGAPLTITSDFSVTAPGVALSLRGGSVSALGNLTVGEALRLGIESPANLSVAGVLNTGYIAPPGTAHSAAVSLDAAAVTASTGLRFGGIPGSFRSLDARPGAGLTLRITGPGGVLFGPGGINGASFNGGGNLDAGVNPAPGTLPDPRDAGAFTVNAQGDIIVNVPIHATTGRNTTATQTGGAGGSVELTSENGTVSVNSTIEVSSNDPAERRRSAKGGNIRLTSKKLTGIAIQHTGQLKALLDAVAPGPGGEITFASLGGDIVVNGGTVTADRGKIDIRNQGGSGLVNLSGATLAADVVKVGALGSDGMLRIGGGSIDANTTIQLYAGGSNGTVEFVDNVTLSGGSMKTIAANTVTIVNGKVVTILGPAASVFTNHANYAGSGGNGSTTGSFGGSGASTFAFDPPGIPPF